jgi:cell division GTPase FtsZ
MKFALVGVGEAGGRIVDALRKVETNSDRSFSKEQLLAFDTTKAAFEQYDHIPVDRHVLIGDTHPEIRGEGLDGDVDLGAEVAREDSDEIYREFDKIATHNVDATLVVAGFGGGTGGGVGPVIAEGLQSISDNPVYVLGILPHESESDQQSLNAARALQSYVDIADNVMLFDNDGWYEGQDPIEEQYTDLNVELVTRIVAVLATGEIEDARLPENMLDTSDLMKALESGGVSSLGYATKELDRPEGLVDRLLSLFRSSESDDRMTDAAQIKELIQATVKQKLTLPCEVDSTERAILVLTGPPDVCSRKGFETGRYWLEQETDTVQIWAGDEPVDGSLIAASVLLSNVTDVPRIERLQDRAVAYQRKLDGEGSLPGEGEESEDTTEAADDEEPAAAEDDAGAPDEDDTEASGEETETVENLVDEAETTSDEAAESANGDADEPADGDTAEQSEESIGEIERLGDGDS